MLDWAKFDYIHGHVYVFSLTKITISSILISFLNILGVDFWWVFVVLNKFDFIFTYKFQNHCKFVWLWLFVVGGYWAKILWIMSLRIIIWSQLFQWDSFPDDLFVWRYSFCRKHFPKNMCVCWAWRDILPKINWRYIINFPQASK